MGYAHVGAAAPQRPEDPLEQESQTDVSHLMRLLGIKLRAPKEAASACNHRASHTHFYGCLQVAMQFIDQMVCEA